jgi:tetratricopeptide (TPR) repeat protein
LDDALADGHTALAMCYLFYTWDWPAAHVELQRTMALDPNSSDPLHFYSHYLEITRRTDEAITVMRKALELDPLSLVINAEYGNAMYYARRFEEAVQALRKTLEMDRSFSYASLIMAEALDRMGRYDEAIAELERVGTPGGMPILIELACAHAAAGHSQEARRILAEQIGKREFTDAGLIASAYAELHDPEETFRWLEKAYNERSALISFLNAEPKFHPFRSDPRFVNLLRRLKLV